MPLLLLLNRDLSFNTCAEGLNSTGKLAVNEPQKRTAREYRAERARGRGLSPPLPSPPLPLLANDRVFTTTIVSLNIPEVFCLQTSLSDLKMIGVFTS